MLLMHRIMADQSLSKPYLQMDLGGLALILILIFFDGHMARDPLQASVGFSESVGQLCEMLLLLMALSNHSKILSNKLMIPWILLVLPMEMISLILISPSHRLAHSLPRLQSSQPHLSQLLHSLGLYQIYLMTTSICFSFTCGRITDEQV
ncbi:hypothetical protein K438DRAFT_1872376 [Mycena galopus ATCC 62051]|nr:hypothetical protein K438DRAFT_1872376 [Mycena galopus ATCC 62051]